MTDHPRDGPERLGAGSEPHPPKLSPHELASRLIHDFNNVLMGIQPIVEVLRRRYCDDEKLMRLIEPVAASLARGKQIIKEARAVIVSTPVEAGPPRLSSLDAGRTSPGLDPARPAGPEPRRALLVEDDEAVAGGIVSLLEVEGLDVRMARSGGEALRLLTTFAPGLVILDVTLPDMTGPEVYEAITRDCPGMPVIFSTGYSVEEGLEPYRQLPNVAVLFKPYTMEDLLKAIEMLAPAS